ncbi:MAG TPA: hypothetical protein VJ066_00635, partial [Candidatus Bathyarchaeia archaeon]|nr:hypothetical protein [Candidatus Bathyarchaeia archaeon]
EEKTDALLKTVAYVSRHNLQAVLLLVHDSENGRQIARYAAHNSEFRDWLNKNEFTEMNHTVENWVKTY